MTILSHLLTRGRGRGGGCQWKFQECEGGRVGEELVDVFTSSNITFSLVVLCPYREQLACLAQLLHDSPVEVCTIDRFQGRDADVVIISLTRTGNQGPSSAKMSILDDMYRINVAITRAKKKLIMIGDRHALRDSPALDPLLDACQGSIVQAQFL